MLLPLLIALLVVWAAAALFAVSLCMVTGRADRHAPLRLVGNRS